MDYFSLANNKLQACFVDKTFWLVIGLGVNCTIGYGTLFYSFSLLSIELEQAFSWSKEFIFGIYSFGILLSGLASPFIGKLLDKSGVHIPMSAGSLVVALSLFALSQVNTQLEFSIALLVMEVASILVLYESAFVALTQAAGKSARLPITQITLFAGFASTIFWPAISWVLTWGDWRVVYQLMGGLHLLVCLPLHWLVLKPLARHSRPAQAKHQAKQSTPIKPQGYAIEGVLALSLGFSAFVIASLQIHLFRIFTDLAIAEQFALLAGIFIGPFQVLSRLLDLFIGRRISPVQLGFFSLGTMTLGIVLLLLMGLITEVISPLAIILFACLFGIGQGLSYIIRGAIPLSLFDAQAYGTITGRLNGVRMVMTAIAPVSFALLMEYQSTIFALVVLLVLLGLSKLGLWWLQQQTSSDY